MKDLLKDNDIKIIEEEILCRYNDRRHDYYDYRRLLNLRKDMINYRVLSHQEELLPDIIAFNDELTKALREMYDRAYRIWESIEACKDYGEDTWLSAMCFLDKNYPELHPVQDEGRQEFWEALCDGYWHFMYSNGVTICGLNLPMDPESFESFIGMDCPPPNWNEGLDQELTKDLHLTSAFHHLFSHTAFAITDFIYVRKFETKFQIECS